MINIIAAISKNGIIGNNHKIPWNIPEDKKHFSKITQNSVLIMGRHTFEEIGKSLPNRYIVVVSKTKEFISENVFTCKDLNNAIKYSKNLIKNQKYKEIFICGGTKIYEEGLKFADKLYITWIDPDYNGDAFFPKIDFKKYTKISSAKLISSSDIKLTFETYIKYI